MEFGHWFDLAIASGIPQPNAMTLATVGNDQPSARIVLLKGFNESGFVFFTNHQSQKGQEIAGNPNVALCFVWLDLHRQIRILGAAQRVSDDESDSYFATRPRGAQIAASASSQSQVLSSRAELEDRFQQIEGSAGESVIRPTHWGGYRVVPTEFEFWQGQPNRLHDRLRYCGQDDDWIIDRLAP